MSLKQFYPFKDYSTWPNTEKLKPKILCPLGTHERRFEFDTWGNDPRLKDSFFNNSDVIATSKFSSAFNTYWQLWWKTAPQTKLNSNKSVYETAPKSLFWAITCVPAFENAPWLACWKSHCWFANQNEGKFETHFRRVRWETRTGISSLLRYCGGNFSKSLLMAT